MTFARITGEGLASIGILVILLWGCILVEDSTMKTARRETARVLSDLQKLRDGGKAVPVSHPIVFPPIFRPVAG